MREPTERLLSCREAEALIQQVLDGDLMDAVLRTRLDAHLEDCAACRSARSGLSMVQDGLRALVETPLPDEALEQVWRRTSRSGWRAFRHRGLDWRMAAAAASIALLAWVGVSQWPERAAIDPGYVPIYVGQVSDQPPGIVRMPSPRVVVKASS